MNDMARIVRSGEAQSVELPEGYRFDTDDVHISRDGDRVILEPGKSVDAETGLPLAALRQLVADGLDSGPAAPLDMGALKRMARETRNVRR